MEVLPLFWLNQRAGVAAPPAWMVEGSSASSSWLTATEEKGTRGSRHPG